MTDVFFCCNTCKESHKAITMQDYETMFEYRCECCGNYTQKAKVAKEDKK